MPQQQQHGWTGRSGDHVAGAEWLPFIPFSVETYGRLGKPALGFLGQLGAVRNVSKSGFVAVAIRELSMELHWENFQMYRAPLDLHASRVGCGLDLVPIYNTIRFL
jgi:hypothetical protein